MDFKVKGIVLLIVILLVIFVIGAGLGIFFQMQKDAPKIKSANLLINTLSSKAVPSIVAFGKVTSINGKNITLSFNGGSVTIKINDNAVVSSMSANAQDKSAPQKITFSQIKIGDTLNISIKVFSDGQLLGQSVIIVSSSVPVK